MIESIIVLLLLSFGVLIRPVCCGGRSVSPLRRNFVTLHCRLAGADLLSDARRAAAVFSALCAIQMTIFCSRLTFFLRDFFFSLKLLVSSFSLPQSVTVCEPIFSVAACWPCMMQLSSRIPLICISLQLRLTSPSLAAGGRESHLCFCQFPSTNLCLVSVRKIHVVC